jgi:hypothetical protein
VTETEQQQYSMRQSLLDMQEMSRIATELTLHRDKFRQRRHKLDDEGLQMQARLLVMRWLDQARARNPLRPLGPALDLARQAKRGTK